jgi:hypothetical protein
MANCRFCKDHEDAPVKYGTRHYAHFNCYLDAGKRLEDLHGWQVNNFPYRLLKERGLLAEAERLTAADNNPNTRARPTRAKAF